MSPLPFSFENTKVAVVKLPFLTFKVYVYLELWENYKVCLDRIFCFVSDHVNISDQYLNTYIRYNHRVVLNGMRLMAIWTKWFDNVYHLILSLLT